VHHFQERRLSFFVREIGLVGPHLPVTRPTSQVTTKQEAAQSPSSSLASKHYSF
jgi:hypothetical protein